jgi:hypothetical protein
MGQDLTSRIGAQLKEPCQDAAFHLQRLIENKRPKQKVEDSAFGFVSDNQEESSDKGTSSEPDAIEIAQEANHEEDRDPYMAEIEAMERKMTNFTPKKIE